MFVKINCETRYMWRAGNHKGEVLEADITKKRNKTEALKFLRKAVKRYGKPHKTVTDRLKSYCAAMKDIGNKHYQKVGRRLNNLCENSHLPFR